MTKKRAMINLVIIGIVGSFVCFYATNLLMSDLSNMFYMTITKDIISSLPLFFIGLDFVLAAIADIRLYRHPEFKKAEIRLYSVILAFFSIAGIWASIFTAIEIYGNVFAPYPFIAAPLICLIVHAALLIFAVVKIVKLKSMQDDLQKRKFNLNYIGYSVMLAIVTFLAFDRLGALIWMPVYVQTSTLWLTWPFYVSLLIPVGLLCNICIMHFELNKKVPKLALYWILGTLAADIIFGGLVFILGTKYPEFIAAISPALALERLATKPVDTILQFVAVIILGIYSIISLRIRFPELFKKNK